MMTPRNLTVWVAAYTGDAVALKTLSSHWFSDKIQLTAAQVTLIVGPDTVFTKLGDQIVTKIVATGELTAPNVNNGNLSALQWAKGNLLNNPALAFNTTYTKNYTSMADIGMNFIAQPEITQSGCDAAFTYQQAVKLFNQNLDLTTNPDANGSLLAPGLLQLPKLVRDRQMVYYSGNFRPHPTPGCLYLLLRLPAE